MQQIFAAKSGDYCHLSILSSDKKLFNGRSDYRHFLDLIKEFLIANPQVELVAYCFDKSSVEIIFFVELGCYINDFLNDLFNKYCKYFSDKHRVDLDKIFSNYSIEMIPNERIVTQSRDIHKKPKRWLECENSSLRAYLYGDAQIELNKDPILSHFANTVEYFNYLNDSL